MAPGSRGRHRPRKIPKGWSRMDAAVDAMRPYGFSEDLIVKTMKELLNVYTDEGWPLIEDSSYAVLREALLEKFEEESKKMDDVLYLEHGSGSGSNTIAAEPSSEAPLPNLIITETDTGLGSNAIAAEPSSEAPVPTPSEMDTSEAQVMEIDTGLGSSAIAAGPSSEASVPTPSNVGMDTSELQVIETVDTGLGGDKIAAEPSNMELNTSESQVIETVAQTDGVPDPSHKEISAVESQATKTIDTSTLTNNVPRESICSSPNCFINFPERLDALPTRKQRPYHGWICGNNDEKPDLVYLTPAPLPKALTELFRMHRKRRWDMKPV